MTVIFYIKIFSTNAQFSSMNRVLIVTDFPKNGRF